MYIYIFYNIICFTAAPGAQTESLTSSETGNTHDTHFVLVSLCAQCYS